MVMVLLGVVMILVMIGGDGMIMIGLVMVMVLLGMVVY